jgi:hypothetical protein
MRLPITRRRGPYPAFLIHNERVIVLLLVLLLLPTFIRQERTLSGFLSAFCFEPVVFNGILSNNRDRKKD